MTPSRMPAVRRVVFGCALLAALAFWLPSRPPEAFAQTAAPSAAPSVQPPAPPATDKRRSSVEITARVRDNAANAANGANAATSPEPAGASSESAGSTPADANEIVIEKDGHRVRVRGFTDDRDIDSLQDLVDKGPAIAGMVVGIVAIVFLTPVLIIIAVMSYRMRKARMLNQTLIKLAERGVAPPAELMQAVANDPKAAMTLVAGSTTASTVEQVQAVRKRAAWSDLRKGIILAAIGLAFVVHGITSEGAPGFPGLILLFLGLAYAVLWWFEDRQVGPARPGASGNAS